MSRQTVDAETIEDFILKRFYSNPPFPGLRIKINVVRRAELSETGCNWTVDKFDVTTPEHEGWLDEASQDIVVNRMASIAEEADKRFNLKDE
ncbi:MAG TPA: hypothetical protein VF666_01705 [Pyrinomonadaceae bacterium]|jgi:hypothetical protein